MSTLTMLDAFFIFLLIYLLAGIEIARAVDSRQMKEHVPFADFPSMFRLHEIRAVVFSFMVLFGPIVFVEALGRRFLRHMFSAERKAS